MSDDVRDVIARALEQRHEQDQNDPILKHHALRLNAHLYAFAVTDALAEAGYEVVKQEGTNVSAQ